MLRLAVLISGGGRTFENIIDSIERGHLETQVDALISTRKNTPAYAIADRAGVAHQFVSWKTLGAEQASKRVWEICQGVDLVICAGLLKLLILSEEWEGRVLNIHPSLLPKYGGKGFYGNRVHQAVLDGKDEISGCSVHVVDAIFDNGKIISQLEVPVLPGDSAEILAARVFEKEKILYPRVIQSIAKGELTLPL